MYRFARLQTVALLLGGWVSTASATSVEEQTSQLTQYGGLGDFEARCKKSIPVSIDPETFAPALAMAEFADKASNLYRHCSKPVRGVTEWCSNGYEKNVQEQITSYVCKYSTNEPAITLADGVLTMTTDWKPEPNDWSKNAVGDVLMDGDFSVAQAALVRNDTGRIKDAMADMSRRCGGEVGWTVDWKSFRGELGKRTGKNDLPAIWQQCSAPLMALEALCNNDQAELMRDQVSEFVCHFDPDTEAEIVLEGKTLSLTSNFSAGGLKEWASILVGDTLRDGEFTVRQAAYMRDEDAHFEDLYSKLVDSKCGTEIAASIDWKGFVGEVDKRLSFEEKTSIYAGCGVPLNRLADVCEVDTNHKIKSMITSYTCHAGDSGRKLALSSGALAYHVDFGADDAYGAVDTFLVQKRVIAKKPPPKKLSPKDLASIRRILAEGANIQRCYKGCANRCGTQACKNACRSGCQ